MVVGWYSRNSDGGVRIRAVEILVKCPCFLLVPHALAHGEEVGSWMLSCGAGVVIAA
jgi:hypothetical protein